MLPFLVGRSRCTSPQLPTSLTTTLFHRLPPCHQISYPTSYPTDHLWWLSSVVRSVLTFDPFRTYCFPNNSTNVQYQLWDTAPYGTTGLIRLHSNTNLCLDAGSVPSNNGLVKIWTCGEGWAQQLWQQFANQGLVQTANSASLVSSSQLPSSQLPSSLSPPPSPCPPPQPASSFVCGQYQTVASTGMTTDTTPRPVP